MLNAFFCKIKFMKLNFYLYHKATLIIFDLDQKILIFSIYFFVLFLIIYKKNVTLINHLLKFTYNEIYINLP